MSGPSFVPTVIAALHPSNMHYSRGSAIQLTAMLTDKFGKISSFREWYLVCRFYANQWILGTKISKSRGYWRLARLWAGFSRSWDGQGLNQGWQVEQYIHWENLFGKKIYAVCSTHKLTEFLSGKEMWVLCACTLIEFISRKEMWAVYSVLNPNPLTMQPNLT